MADAAQPPATPGEEKPAEDKKGDSDETIKKQKPEQPLPADLAGTLQNLFTQTEQADATPLKPLRRPKLIYQPTYRLWPYKQFNNDHVQAVVEMTLEGLLGNIKYKPELANDIVMKVSERIRMQVLSLRYDRCKIIVLLTLGPLYRQGIHIGMKCLWDPTRDSYVSYTYKNPYIYCNCCVYGIYFEWKEKHFVCLDIIVSIQNHESFCQ